MSSGSMVSSSEPACCRYTGRHHGQTSCWEAVSWSSSAINNVSLCSSLTCRLTSPAHSQMTLARPVLHTDAFQCFRSQGPGVFGTGKQWHCPLQGAGTMPGDTNQHPREHHWLPGLSLRIYRDTLKFPPHSGATVDLSSECRLRAMGQI